MFYENVLLLSVIFDPSGHNDISTNKLDITHTREKKLDVVLLITQKTQSICIIVKLFILFDFRTSESVNSRPFTYVSYKRVNSDCKALHFAVHDERSELNSAIV